MGDECANSERVLYSPLNNEIVVPAAILQAPFFDYRADSASNYSAIGFIITHEITHWFDLSRSKFDQRDNLSDWWTEVDRERFEALNDDLVVQYDAIEVLPDLLVNGQLTVTENVADLDGIETVYDALKSLLAPEIDAVAVTDSDPQEFTPQQRFFIAAATVWRGKMRDEALITHVRSGVHAPPEVRATQPLRNTEEFYEAFGITRVIPCTWRPLSGSTSGNSTTTRHCAGSPGT